jgi:hypothetical protein
MNQPSERAMKAAEGVGDNGYQCVLCGYVYMASVSECDCEVGAPFKSHPMRIVDVADLARAIDAAVLAERERAAKVAEERQCRERETLELVDAYMMRRREAGIIAQAIRAGEGA